MPNFKRKNLSPFATFLAAALMSGAVHGTNIPSGVGDYYVAMNGSDTNGDGSPDAPYATLFKAAQIANASSGNKTIYIKTGGYILSQSIQLRTGVSIDAASRDLVSIRCAYQTGDQRQAAIYLGGDVEGVVGNQTLKNFTLDGSLDGSTPYGVYGIYTRGRSAVQCSGLRVVNFATWGITFSGQASEVDGLGPTVLATANKMFDCIVDNSSHYAEIGGGSIGYGCFQYGGQDGLEYYNNTITQTSRPTGQNGYCVKMYRNGYNRNCIEHHNTIKHKNDGMTFPFAVEMWNSFAFLQHHNNIDGGVDLICTKGEVNYGNAGPVVGAPYGCRSVSNVFTITTTGLNGAGNAMAYNLEDQAIGVCSDFEIEDNILTYTGTADKCTFIKIFSTATSAKLLDYARFKIANNICIRARFIGDVNGGAGDGTGLNAYTSYTDWEVTNNTCDGKDVTWGCVQWVRGIWNNLKYTNNIITGYTNNSIYTGYSGKIVGYIEDKNLIFGNGNNVRQFDASGGGVAPTGVSGTNLSSATTRAATFVDASTNDFHLKAGSLAIDAGVANTLTTDYAGTARTGANDVGAYAYV